MRRRDDNGYTDPRSALEERRPARKQKQQKEPRQRRRMSPCCTCWIVTAIIVLVILVGGAFAGYTFLNSFLKNNFDLSLKECFSAVKEMYSVNSEELLTNLPTEEDKTSGYNAIGEQFFLKDGIITEDIVIDIVEEMMNSADGSTNPDGSVTPDDGNTPPPEVEPVSPITSMKAFNAGEEPVPPPEGETTTPDDGPLVILSEILVRENIDIDRLSKYIADGYDLDEHYANECLLNLTDKQLAIILNSLVKRMLSNSEDPNMQMVVSALDIKQIIFSRSDANIPSLKLTIAFSIENAISGFISSGQQQIPEFAVSLIKLVTPKDIYLSAEITLDELLSCSLQINNMQQSSMQVIYKLIDGITEMTGGERMNIEQKINDTVNEQGQQVLESAEKFINIKDAILDHSLEVDLFNMVAQQLVQEGGEPLTGSEVVTIFASVLATDAVEELNTNKAGSHQYWYENDGNPIYSLTPIENRTDLISYENKFINELQNKYLLRDYYYTDDAGNIFTQDPSNIYTKQDVTFDKIVPLFGIGENTTNLKVEDLFEAKKLKTEYDIDGTLTKFIEIDGEKIKLDITDQMLSAIIASQLSSILGENSEMAKFNIQPCYVVLKEEMLDAVTHNVVTIGVKIDAKSAIPEPLIANLLDDIVVLSMQVDITPNITIEQAIATKLKLNNLSTTKTHALLRMMEKAGFPLITEGQIQESITVPVRDAIGQMTTLLPAVEFAQSKIVMPNVYQLLTDMILNKDKPDGDPDIITDTELQQNMIYLLNSNGDNDIKANKEGSHQYWYDDGTGNLEFSITPKTDSTGLISYEDKFMDEFRYKYLLNQYYYTDSTGNIYTENAPGYTQHEITFDELLKVFGVGENTNNLKIENILSVDKLTQKAPVELAVDKLIVDIEPEKMCGKISDQMMSAIIDGKITDFLPSGTLDDYDLHVAYTHISSQNINGVLHNFITLGAKINISKVLDNDLIKGVLDDNMVASIKVDITQGITDYVKTEIRLNDLTKAQTDSLLELLRKIGITALNDDFLNNNVATPVRDAIGTMMSTLDGLAISDGAMVIPNIYKLMADMVINKPEDPDPMTEDEVHDNLRNLLKSSGDAELENNKNSSHKYWYYNDGAPIFSISPLDRVDQINYEDVFMTELKDKYLLRDYYYTDSLGNIYKDDPSHIYNKVNIGFNDMLSALGMGESSAFKIEHIIDAGKFKRDVGHGNIFVDLPGEEVQLNITDQMMSVMLASKLNEILGTGNALADYNFNIGYVRLDEKTVGSFTHNFITLGATLDSEKLLKDDLVKGLLQGNIVVSITIDIDKHGDTNFLPTQLAFNDIGEKTQGLLRMLDKLGITLLNADEIENNIAKPVRDNLNSMSNAIEGGMTFGQNKMTLPNIYKLMSDMVINKTATTPITEQELHDDLRFLVTSSYANTLNNNAFNHMYSNGDVDKLFVDDTQVEGGFNKVDYEQRFLDTLSDNYLFSDGITYDDMLGFMGIKENTNNVQFTGLFDNTKLNKTFLSRASDVDYRPVMSPAILGKLMSDSIKNYADSALGASGASYGISLEQITIENISGHLIMSPAISLDVKNLSANAGNISDILTALLDDKMMISFHIDITDGAMTYNPTTMTINDMTPEQTQAILDLLGKLNITIFTQENIDSIATQVRTLIGNMSSAINITFDENGITLPSIFEMMEGSIFKDNATGVTRDTIRTTLRGLYEETFVLDPSFGAKPEDETLKTTLSKALSTDPALSMIKEFRNVYNTKSGSDDSVIVSVIDLSNILKFTDSNGHEKPLISVGNIYFTIKAHKPSYNGDYVINNQNADYNADLNNVITAMQPSMDGLLQTAANAVGQTIKLYNMIP